eukprot:7371148-Prymnesium_polylepis.1
MMGMTAADMIFMFFTTPVVVATNDTFDDYDEENDRNIHHDHNIEHSDVVDQSSKGPGRGWGGVRSDGGRYTKKDKNRTPRSFKPSQTTKEGPCRKPCNQTHR